MRTIQQESEGKTLLSRREVLLPLAILFGGGLGVAARRIITNESDGFIYGYEQDELLQRARYLGQVEGRPQLLGLHPDFDHSDERAFEQLHQYQNEIGPVSTVNCFGVIEDFSFPDKAKTHRERMNAIHDFGATPMISLGTSSVDIWKGSHPFSASNIFTMQQQAERVALELSELRYRKYVRLFYEFNLSAFPYGEGRGLSKLAHAAGFKRSFKMFRQAFDKYPDSPVDLVFCPSVHYDFADHWPIDESGAPLAQAAGPDGYRLWPGKRKFMHPYYWWPGKQTPEEVFLPSLQKLQKLSQGQIPLMICEAGDMAKDPNWWYHLGLFGYAFGLEMIMPFVINKAHRPEIHETDWSFSTDEITAWKKIFLDLKKEDDIR